MDDATKIPDVSGRRVNYANAELGDGHLLPTPLAQFLDWYGGAERSLAEPNAVVLATADASGPTARTVLLKGIAPAGFTVFTNMLSLKGRQLAANPRATLLFPWHDMQRQVRIRAIASRVDDQRADDYFASRARGSQLSAWASQQSGAVASRAEMDRDLAAAEQRFSGGEVPRPEFWSGYEFRPYEVEFWAGRGSRFHDRLVFLSNDGSPALLDDAAQWEVARRYP